MNPFSHPKLLRTDTNHRRIPKNHRLVLSMSGLRLLPCSRNARVPAARAFCLHGPAVRIQPQK